MFWKHYCACVCEKKIRHFFAKTKPEKLSKVGDWGPQEKGGGAKNMGFLFWCLRLQFWSYYDHVVTGMTILEDGIKKEDKIRIKTYKEFADLK